jgi:hypothetical protein
MYDAIQQVEEHHAKAAILRRYKTKILLLHKRRTERTSLNIQHLAPYTDEPISMFHLVKSRKRRAATMITQIVNEDGNAHTTMHEIMKTFFTKIQNGYTDVPVEETSIKEMETAARCTLTDEQWDVLVEIVAKEEVRLAIFQGAKNKSAGADGISLEFFQETWDEHSDLWHELFNTMYSEHIITARQRQGIFVCVRKTPAPLRPRDYRPIDILNADYKILARINANRLRPLLSDVIHPHQYCGREGGSIYEALATIRDAIAHTEITKTPMAMVSLDFSEAFDRISRLPTTDSGAAWSRRRVSETHFPVI